MFHQGTRKATTLSNARLSFFLLKLQPRKDFSSDFLRGQPPNSHLPDLSSFTTSDWGSLDINMDESVEGVS